MSENTEPEEMEYDKKIITQFIGQMDPPLLQEEASDECEHLHCDLHVGSEIKHFDQLENIGSWAPYRCIRCRSCSDCRKAELLEKVSLVEEREQALIESSVYFDVNKGKLVACLPFVSDPKLQLFPNERIARRKNLCTLLKKRTWHCQEKFA